MHSYIVSRLHPWMFNDLGNGQPFIHVPIEHFANQIDTVLRERQKRYPQWMVHDFVDIIKGVFLIDHRVQKNSKSPDVLLFTSVWSALKNFRSGVV